MSTADFKQLFLDNIFKDKNLNLRALRQSISTDAKPNGNLNQQTAVIIDKYIRDNPNMELIDTQEEVDKFITDIGNLDRTAGISEANQTKPLTREEVIRNSIWAYNNGVWETKSLSDPIIVDKPTSNNTNTSSNNTTTSQTAATLNDIETATSNNADLKTYWGLTDFDKSFANLGIDKAFVNDSTNHANLTAGLEKLNKLDGYIVRVNSNATEASRTPEALLGGSYRLTALAALVQIVGGADKLKKGSDGSDAPKEEIRKKIIAALDTTQKGGGTNGETFFNDFLKTGWADTNDASNTKALEYVATPSSGGPGALGTYDQTQLLAQARQITSDDAKDKATGWLGMYGNGGVGGRNFKVSKNGDVNADASVSRNMPAFAMRWLVSDISGFSGDFEQAIVLLNTRLGIDLDIATLAPLKLVVETKFNSLTNNGTEPNKFKDFVAGLLATSIQQVAVSEVNTRRVSITLDMNNLVERLFAHIASSSNAAVNAAKSAMKTAIVGSSPTKDVVMTLGNNISWDKGTTVPDSGAYQVLNELFNNKANNDNYTGNEKTSAVIEKLDKKAPVKPASTAANTTSSTNTTVVKTDEQIKALTPKTYTPPTGTTLSQEDATLLVANYLRAKRDIYGSSYENTLAAKLTTGERLKVLNEERQRLQAQAVPETTEYKSQVINKVDSLNTTTANKATMDVEITEEIGSNEAVTNPYTVTFAKDGTSWKIADIVKKS